MRDQSWWTARFVAAVFVPFLLANASFAQAKYPTEIYQDFRGKRELLSDFRLTGPDIDDVVNAENEGLRIHLPKTRQENSQNIEVAANFVLTGDFEITGTFELLHADMPTDGWGVGVCLSLSDTHTIDKFLKVGRYMRPKAGSVFYAESWTKGAKDLKNPSVKTEASKGQLRLVREGQRVRCQVSENVGKEFITLFTREDFGAEDLVHLRFAVSDGNKSHYRIDTRLVDLRVRYGDARNPAPAAAPIPLTDRPRTGLFAAQIIVGFMLFSVLAFALVMFFYLRRRRTEELVNDKTTVDAVRPDSVSFACTSCHKKLTAKAGLAGKTIKCPRCAHAVHVPVDDEA